MTRTELSPVPMPRMIRPPLSSSIVAAADAVTVAWRVSGLVTLVPSTIVVVRAAATPRVTQTSRLSSWLSGTHA